MDTDKALEEILKAVAQYAVDIGGIWDHEGRALEKLKEVVEEVLIEYRY